MTKSKRRLICEAPVLYVDGDGQTGKIAGRIAATLRGHGLDSRAIEVGSPQEKALDWSSVRAAVMGASTYRQWHQNDAHAFIDAHADDLNSVPSAFFSVGLSTRSDDVKEQEANRRLVESFPALHQWRPAIIVSLAGHLTHSQVDILRRWLMKQLTGKERIWPEWLRHYEFTNWEKVDRLARAFVGVVHARAARPGTAA